MSDVSNNSSDIIQINNKLNEIDLHFDDVDNNLDLISIDIVNINNLLTSYKSLLDQNI